MFLLQLLGFHVLGKTELYSLAESTQLFIQFTSSKLNNVINIEISELKLCYIDNKLLLIFHRIETIWTNSNHDYCIVLKIFTTHPLKFSWFTSPPPPTPLPCNPHETFFISLKIAETLWLSLHYTIETGAARYLSHMNCTVIVLPLDILVWSITSY